MKRFLNSVLLLLCLGCPAWIGSAGAAESAPEQGPTGLEPPLLDTRALLIRDPAIVADLQLTDQQSEVLRQLSDALDGLLFSLRDAGPRPTDDQQLSAIKQVDAKLESLPQILSTAQQQRLTQLRRQYEGIVTLVRPEIVRQLKLTDVQLTQIRRLHRQSLQRQKEAASKENSAALIQRIQQEQLQQTIQVLDESQREQWLRLLGKPFDFSTMRRAYFHAPELRQVSAWINSPPLSLESLKGKVVIVHFWTFGCINCIRNYPAYKDWFRRYDSENVAMLGIHTPELKSEHDLDVLKQKVRTEGLDFPIAVDNDKANWNAWSNRAWPSVYLVDKNGRVRFWWYGELNWQGATGDQWITERINRLLKEPPRRAATATRPSPLN